MYISFDLSNSSIRVLIVGRTEDSEKIVYFLYPLSINMSEGIKITLKFVEILFDDNETILLHYEMGDGLELSKPLATYRIDS